MTSKIREINFLVVYNPLTCQGRMRDEVLLVWEFSILSVFQ